MRCFDTDAAAEGLLKRLLTSSSFTAPMATFVRRKTEIEMEEKKYSDDYASTDV